LTAWHLTQLAAAHDRADHIAAAAALDRARATTTTIAAMLARHQPLPSIGPVAGRYLKRSTTTRLTTSWHADPTTTDGLAHATAAIVTELRHIRYTALHILGTDLPWPWGQLTIRLRPLLDDHADLTPRPPHDGALYTTDLAATYDQHRPIPPQMANGLRDLAQRWLHGIDVLELGAGTGRITAHLANDTRTYRAVEYSPAMAHRLAARTLPTITVQLGDAHHLDLDDNTVDVVVEHEALPFTDDPATVLNEIQRVLRPGGLLLRILVHPVNGDDPTALVDTAYRQAAFADNPGPLIIGKGTDPLLTNLLTQRGWTTHEHTLAIWQHARTIDDLLAPLDARAWPYQHQATSTQHAAGMAAARQAAAGLDGALAGTYRLYILVTAFGAPS
jgi:ubiquinone/menaquinone biosynthesis C-methylase UbiE